MDTTCRYCLHWPSAGVAKEKQGALSSCLVGVYVVTLHADCGSVSSSNLSYHRLPSGLRTDSTAL